MILLLPITKIAVFLAAAYAFFLLVVKGILATNGIDVPPTAALSLAGAIELLLVFFLTFGWRVLWRKFPALNDIVFPDFSGSWDAHISWLRGDEKGTAYGKVLIRQDFFRISIEMDADHSESTTLSLCAVKNAVSGRPELHYIYEVRKKNPKPSEAGIYRGAATLRAGLDRSQLAGQYFTSQAGSGRFEFTRVSVS